MVETYAEMLCKSYLLGLKTGTAKTDRSSALTAPALCYVAIASIEQATSLLPCRGHWQVGEASTSVFTQTLSVLWRKDAGGLPLYSAGSISPCRASPPRPRPVQSTASTAETASPGVKCFPAFFTGVLQP